MGKKIVILFEVHPVATYESRYDYQTIITAGYSLEICDLSGIVSKSHAIGGNELKDSDNVKYHAFYTCQEFKKYITDLDRSTFIWCTFQLTAEYYWIFKVISSHFYGFICNVDYVLPRTASRKKKSAYWTKWTWSRISNAVLYRIPKKFLPIRKSDAVITYGADDIQRKLNNVLYDGHTVVELTNTIDYIECSKVQEAIQDFTLNNLPEKYIVFIDEYMPYHPDGIKMGMKLNDKQYYKEVEVFLQRVSEIMNMPVIIAAHPKADYHKHSECYRGMTIIQFKTAELIKGARFVITHLSIAIGMVIITRKPFIIITTEEVNNVVYAGGILEDQEKDLKRRVINISNHLTNEGIKNEIYKAITIGNEYFDKQISKYRLPYGHPNERLSLGGVMIKAMRKVKTGEGKKI